MLTQLQAKTADNDIGRLQFHNRMQSKTFQSGAAAPLPSKANAAAWRRYQAARLAAGDTVRRAAVDLAEIREFDRVGEESSSPEKILEALDDVQLETLKLLLDAEAGYTRPPRSEQAPYSAQAFRRKTMERVTPLIEGIKICRLMTARIDAVLEASNSTQDERPSPPARRRMGV